MKNVLLLVLSICSFINLLSGQCDFEISEIDKFDKVSIVQTEFETIHKKFMKGRLQIAIGNQDTNKNYVLFRIFIQNFPWSITPERRVSLLFEDDSVIHLMPDEEVISSDTYESKIGTASGSAQVGIIGMQFSEEDFQALHTKKLTNIRLELNEGSREYEIKKGERGKIKDLINCTKKETKRLTNL